MSAKSRITFVRRNRSINVFLFDCVLMLEHCRLQSWASMPHGHDRPSVTST